MRSTSKLNVSLGACMAALCLLLFGLMAASAQTGTALQRAKDLIGKSDYVGAVKAGREATAEDSQSAEAWFVLGRALFEADDYEESATALTKIEPLTDDHHILMDSNRLLGTLNLVYLGDLQKAQDSFQKEITHAREIGDRSDEAQAHYNLGRVLRRKRLLNGDPQDARKEFDEALKLEVRESQSILYRTALAEELLLTGNSTEALRALQVMEDVAARVKDVKVQAKAYLSCGQIYTAIGEDKRKSDVQTEKSQAAHYFESAGTVLMKSFVVLRAAKIEDWYTEALGYKYFGRLVEIQGNIKAAVGRYRQALDRANQAGHHAELVTDLNTRIAALSPLAKQEYVFGAIDIGSKGVKGVLVSTILSDAAPKGSAGGKGKTVMTELYRRSINTDLNQSREANNGNFSAESMKQTAVAIHDLIKEMKRVRKSPFRITSIFVAGSSSLAQGVNRSELARQIFDETKDEDQAPAHFQNATPDSATPFINGSEELLYGIIGSINPEDRETASLVDIGSGNGRWGYIHADSDGRTPVSVDIRLGSVTLAAAAVKSKEESEDYITALEREANQQIGAPLRRQMKENSSFAKCKEVYLIGGAAYALATLMHPEDAKEDEVELTRQDLLDFYDRVKAASAAKPYRPDISQVGDTDTRELAKKQIDDVLLAVFKTREQQLSAAILLKTLAENGLNPKQALVFPRHGGWALGMAEYKYFADQAKAEADKLKPAADAR